MRGLQCIFGVCTLFVLYSTPTTSDFPTGLGDLHYPDHHYSSHPSHTPLEHSDESDEEAHPNDTSNVESVDEGVEEGIDDADGIASLLEEIEEQEELLEPELGEEPDVNEEEEDEDIITVTPPSGSLVEVAHDWITPDPENPSICNSQPYNISTVCNAEVTESTNVTLEQIAGTIFSNIILDRLEDKCTNRTWCLGSIYDGLLMDGKESYLGYCSLVTCLGNMPYSCVDDVRSLYLATLSLLCNAKKTKVSQKCRLSIRRMAHLELITAHQYVSQTCSIPNDDTTVEEPCKTIGRQLHCTCETCSQKLELLQTYEPWNWYFHTLNATQRCEAKNYDCAHYWDVNVPNSWNSFASMSSFLNDGSPKAVSSVVTAVVLSVTGIAFVTWACMRRYHRDKYSRSKVAYSEVTINDEEL